jgi:hypothetical protein
MNGANSDTSVEKRILLALSGGALIVLAIVAVMALKADKVDSNAATMIGVIITGLIAFMKDIVQAIRGYSMSAQLGKVTDQLAASGPVTTEPQEVFVTNTKAEPVPTKDTGDAKANL